MLSVLRRCRPRQLRGHFNELPTIAGGLQKVTDLRFVLPCDAPTGPNGNRPMCRDYAPNG